MVVSKHCYICFPSPWSVPSPFFLSLSQAGVLPAHPRLYLEAARNRAAAEQSSTSRQDDDETSDTPTEPSSLDETIEKC